MVYYHIASEENKKLLEEAMKQWHPELQEKGVRIEMIMATSSTRDKPAVAHGGYPALARIRIIGLKDRLTKKYDAEMLVDERIFKSLKEPQKLALIDHVLSHLTLQRTKPTKKCPITSVLYDDLGRPKLKTKKGDWNAGDGFSVVCARHGEFAIEFENLRLAYGRAQAAANDGEIK